MLRFPSSVFAVTALLAAGCADQPSDQDYDDVAASVGALVANDSGGEVGSMQDSLTAAKGEVPTGLSAMGSGSVQGVRGGLMYSYAVTCQSASGEAMSACNAMTDRARVTVNWSGNVSYPRYSATVNRSGDWSVSGLTTDTAEFSGMGTFDVASELRSLAGDRRTTFALHYAATYEGLRFTTVDRVVQAGTIRYDVNAKRTREGRIGDVERELDIDVLVTFLGGGRATVTLDADRRYDLNLTTGAVVKN